MIAASIKRSTAAVHVDAEAAVRSFDPFASIDRYASSLACLVPFYEGIEPRLVAWLGDVVPDAARRFDKAGAVRADLRSLGARPLPSRASRVVRTPRIDSVARALGVAYVLEGKTLGARFLLAEARESLGLDVDRGATFLAGYGTQTGPMWNAYRASLEGWVARHGRRTNILAGAHATFASFIACVSCPQLSSMRRAAS